MVEREERHHRMLGTESSLQDLSCSLYPRTSATPVDISWFSPSHPLTSAQLSPQKRFACWESSPSPPTHEFLGNHSASIFLEHNHWKFFIYVLVTYLIPLTGTGTSFKNSVAACRINKPSSQICHILYNESFLPHGVIHKEGQMRLSMPRGWMRGKRPHSNRVIVLQKKEGPFAKPMHLGGLFL